jgi:hypothetical protein
LTKVRSTSGTQCNPQSQHPILYNGEKIRKKCGIIHARSNYVLISKAQLEPIS